MQPRGKSHDINITTSLSEQFLIKRLS